MERKLGITNAGLRDVDSLEALRLIKEAGFDCFFSPSYNMRAVLEMKNEAERLGLDFEFLHGPAGAKHPSGSALYMNHVWKATPDYVPLMDAILTSIDCAAEAEIKTVVLHVNGDWKPPMISDIGLARFDRIVAHAVRRGVHIAFENLRTHGTLAALMERYERVPEVGFCYDCGHEHCYTESIPYLDIFGNRTLCTHIHDNFGRDKEDPLKDADYHYLPFEGDIDYAAMMRKLDKYGYAGSLMLEVSQRHYGDISAEEFLAIAYERAKKLSQL